eukprot:4477968-Prymnesium_polylepis.1
MDTRCVPSRADGHGIGNSIAHTNRTHHGIGNSIAHTTNVGRGVLTIRRTPCVVQASTGCDASANYALARHQC